MQARDPAKVDGSPSSQGPRPLTAHNDGQGVAWDRRAAEQRMDALRCPQARPHVSRDWSSPHPSNSNPRYLCSPRVPATIPSEQAAMCHIACVLWQTLPHANSLTCRPEPHILLFRRKLGVDPVTGEFVPELAKAAKAQYMSEFEGATLDA